MACKKKARQGGEVDKKDKPKMRQGGSVGGKMKRKKTTLKLNKIKKKKTKRKRKSSKFQLSFKNSIKISQFG